MLRRNVFGCVLVLAFSAVVSAQEFINEHVVPNSLHVMAVEEDWELVVGDPDPHVCGPQVTCAMSPTGDADSLHAIFNINHQTLGSFIPGGMQLQVWNGEQPLTDRRHPNKAVLTRREEKVQWTQKISVSDGTLTFCIIGGSSNTWGSFGGQGYLTASRPTSLGNLNQYDPAISIKHSGVVFAANRVQSLRLKRIRAHTDDGNVFTIDVNTAVDD